jgi:putative hemolysin
MKKQNKIKSIFMVVAVAMSLVLSACSGSSSTNSSEAPMVEPKPCPTFVAGEGDLIPQDQADMLIGMTEADGEACAQDLGWLWRVGERDGELYGLTMDYRQNRVTVYLQEGLIYQVNIS